MVALTLYYLSTSQETANLVAKWNILKTAIPSYFPITMDEFDETTDEHANAGINVFPTLIMDTLGMLTHTFTGTETILQQLYGISADFGHSVLQQADEFASPSEQIDLPKPQSESIEKMLRGHASTWGPKTLEALSNRMKSLQEEFSSTTDPTGPQLEKESRSVDGITGPCGFTENP
jgi:hypothetical protein